MSHYAEAWQLDSNPLKQGMNPMAVLGEIPSKAMPDHLHVQDLMNNADDPNLAGEVYPNGNKPIVHDLNVGDLLFAIKCCRNPEVVSGEPNELVFSSMSGDCIGNFQDDEQLMGQYYFVGICKTEYRYSSYGINKDPEHGVGILKVGTHSTSNNGPYLLYPGTKIRYRAPISKISTEIPAEGSIAHRNGEKMNRFARNGASNMQFRPEIVPFDYTDVTVNYLSAFNSMTNKSTDRNGILDIPFYQHFMRDVAGNTTQVSPKQEAAGGHWYGTAGAAAGILEKLLAYKVITIDNNVVIDSTARVENKHAQQVSDLLKNLGVWSQNVDARKPFLEIFANIYFNDLKISNSEAAKHYETVSLVPKDQALRVNASTDEKTLYTRLRFNQSRFHGAHLYGDWFHMTSSIVGVSLNFTAPGDLAHVMWGHFVL